MSKFAIYPSLVGKKVFITGGATGIGEFLVKAFCAQGADVGFIDINASAGQDLVKFIKDEINENVWFRQVDVRDVTALQRAVDDCNSELGGLDVLVNNVANDTRHNPLEVTQDSWRECLSVNLDSAFFASQAAIKIMQEAGSGSIINFSSINAHLAPANMPGYVSAKAALLGLTKALAKEYGPSGIRANCILPGWVVTERQLEKWLTPEAEQAWMEGTPLKSRILPDDVANLALFLGAEDSRMITSQEFVIDGGHI